MRTIIVLLGIIFLFLIYYSLNNIYVKQPSYAKQEYYNNGKPKATSTIEYTKNLPVNKDSFKDVKIVGAMKSFYDTGELESEFKHITKDQSENISYYRNGKIKSKTKYFKNKVQDTFKTYREDGSLEFTTEYSNGIENGMSTKYDGKGRVVFQIPYKNGKREGLGKFYENGILQLSVEYKNDLQNGIQREYDKNGNIIRENIYKNDKEEKWLPYNG